MMGITFSKLYAQQLGLDWKETYSAILLELKPDHVRVPVYWSDLEPEAGKYNFEDYDWMIELAEEKKISITLAIGQKVPRWPECFIPSWVEVQDDNARHESVLKMLREVVERYDSSSAVVSWQVENEVFLQFGKCPVMTLKSVQDEVELVRSLSEKPIAITTSGEMEPWFQVAPFADIAGFSLYRLTWNPVLGFWMYPVQPNFYRARIKALKPFVDEVYVSELQAEPWFHQPIESLAIEDQHQMFSPRMLRANVRFARLLNVPLIDLWGAEWWWYMSENGDGSLWQAAKEIM
jgi:hypothetical protein